jgi:tRNA G18 (ribose-2'-O)-methylase SpoU
MSTIISSPQNDRVKRVRLLQSHAKARRQHRRLVLEGMRLVSDAWAAGVRPDYVFFTDPAAELIAPLETAGIECLLASMN